MTDHAVLRREAAEWFVIMRDTEDPQAETLQEWLRWMELSEDHQRAFEDIAQTWHQAAPPLFAPPALQADDGYDVSMPVAQWRAARDCGDRPRLAGGARLQRSRWFAVAASLLLCAVALYAVKSSIFTRPIANGEFVTRTGEHMNLLLEDGSELALGAQSRISIDFTASARKLRLDAGEAFFTVKKDPRRPFTVRAMDGDITAVGTAFNVRAIGDHVTVSVAEGAIRISETEDLSKATSSDAPTAADAAQLRIERGQQVVYRAVNRVPDLSAKNVDVADPAEFARWRDGWLVYRHESLKYVIADIARYTDLKLQVDEGAAELKFTGVVFRDRIPEWIAALPQVSPVQVESNGSVFTIKPQNRQTVVQR